MASQMPLFPLPSIADVPLRTLSKFIPSEPAIQLPSSHSPSADSDTSDAQSKTLLRSSGQHHDSVQREHDEVQPRPTVWTRAKPSPLVDKAAEIRRGDHDHAALTDDISKLDPADQIDRLLAEIQTLHHRTATQSQALHAFAQQNLQLQKKVDEQLWQIEGRVRRQCAADREDAEKEIRELKADCEECGVWVEVVKEKVLGRFLEHMAEFGAVEVLKGRVGEIEDGIEEVRRRMQRVVEILGARSPTLSPCRSNDQENVEAEDGGPLSRKRKGVGRLHGEEVAAKRRRCEHC